MALLKPKKLISQILQQSKTHWLKLVIAFGLLGLLGFIVYQPLLWPDGLGFAPDKSTTETIEKDEKPTKADPKGRTTKIVVTTKKEPGKTLWDWLSLLGVPLTLAILGVVFQLIQQERQAEETKRQQERAEADATRQREIAADEAKDEILQVYYDRLSALLVDKNLLAIAAKKKAREVAKKKAESEGVNTEASEGSDAKPEDEELLDSALDVIRARTLSILRRFEDDKERKDSVIRFLLEADFISKLKLNLSGANLSGADLVVAKLGGASLSSADLSGADLRWAGLVEANLSDANLSDASLGIAFLRGAILSGADLSGADLGTAFLTGADLGGANLTDANLSCADLTEADLRDVNLRGADLRYADLFGANLGGADLGEAKNLTEAQLADALLCKTKLPAGINLDPDRDCEETGRRSAQAMAWLNSYVAEQEAWLEGQVTELKAQRKARLEAQRKARKDGETSV